MSTDCSVNEDTVVVWVGVSPGANSLKIPIDDLANTVQRFPSLVLYSVFTCKQF